MGRNLQAPSTLVLSDQAVGFGGFQEAGGMFHNLSTGLVATDAVKNLIAHENFCRENNCNARHFHSAPNEDVYPSFTSGPTPSALDSNRVELFKNASLTVPVGPLRCFRMISSATPSSSGSSGL
jgi:hypothetical protein